jgi:23S rRNA (guanine2445-N2)-methyltransferase / 23S rRNA (guanine2069-N7)-methyltransferase
MTADLTFFATAPKGLEGLLADELRELGGKATGERRAGAVFAGDLATAYRACLWSRIANRVLLPLAELPVNSADELYQAVSSISWADHVAPDGTLAVEYHGNLADITHSHYGALRVKDAIVDQLRAQHQIRPSIDAEQPDLRVNVYVHQGKANIAIDLSGSSLHRRGYRAAGGSAPLKENLAAAIIRRAGWQAIADAGGAFVDPMCGSGTLTIEAAMIAADIAPGLQRTYWGFTGWRGHQQALWHKIRLEAQQRCQSGREKIIKIYGFDADKHIIRQARENAHLAGLGERISFSNCPLAGLQRPVDSHGLIAANPPYGERLGDPASLPRLYKQLGDKLLQEFNGWQATVLTSDAALGKALGLRAHKVNKVYNGALECSLLQIDINPDRILRFPLAGTEVSSTSESVLLESDGARMFANRLRKNLQNIGRWAQREGLSCYRLYNTDIPEYAIALDCYDDWVHVQEYAPPRNIDQKQAAHRLQEMLAVIRALLKTPPERLILKRREKQKGLAQYRKLAREKHLITIKEQGVSLLVNLHDYLDTGLFLDHRITRALIREHARGRRFLNLFAYTGTATVYAALGGAKSTTTIDMSRTYLDWARRNMTANGMGGRQHEYIQADCLEWLAKNNQRYDLIFLDPPTFSNSKRMEESFDIQRDHVELLKKTTGLLENKGILLFSCNRRHFKLDKEALLKGMPHIQIEDITAATLPRDFNKQPPIHYCWKIAV